MLKSVAYVINLSSFLLVMVVMLLQRLVSDFYKVLNQVKTEEIPDGLKLPDSFTQLVSEMEGNHYDARTFALMLKAMVCIVLWIHTHFVGKSFFIATFLVI